MAHPDYSFLRLRSGLSFIVADAITPKLVAYLASQGVAEVRTVERITVNEDGFHVDHGKGWTEQRPFAHVVSTLPADQDQIPDLRGDVGPLRLLISHGPNPNG